MITGIAGRTLLDAYNSKYKKKLTPKEFFDKEFYPLFFNSSRFLMSVTNSPFDQGYKQKRHLTTEGRTYDYEEFHKKAASGKFDASIYLGGSASDEKEFAATSGQVSDVLIPLFEDDIFLSWIGSGLGIMVAGAYMLIFDDPKIILQTFEGWKIYRKYLDDPTLEKLRPNQINTWNGQWLTYSLHADFNINFDFSILTDQNVFNIDSEKIEVNTVYWSKLFFSLSQLYPNEVLTAYVYSFGQMNKTIGFIPFQFKAGTKLKSIYRKLTTDDTRISTKDFESLFGMHIKRACELGSIGLQTLRPEGLVKHLTESKNPSFKNDSDKINYYIFKTWLIAMLNKNKEEVTEYTLELATAILRYRNSGTKNDRKTLVETLFENKSKKGFIESLTIMIRDLGAEDLLVMKNFKDEIHLMTNEEFGYFSTLLKFDYAFLEKQANLKS